MDVLPYSGYRSSDDILVFRSPLLFHSVQEVNKDAIAAFALAGLDVAYLADLKKSHAAEKVDIEKWLA